METPTHHGTNIIYIYILVAKAASRSVSARMEEVLAPLQLGYATSKGAEAAVHSARMYLRDLPANYVMVKLDFRNAFNSVRRDRVLEATLEHIPELYPFVYCCYSTSSHLFFDKHILFSQEGVQQGDPLGPLLFCLAIHPLIKKLKSELRIFYLDDGLIGGSTSDVLEDIRLIQREAALLGLCLNLSKSELISHNPKVCSFLQYADLIPIHPEEATFLGAPIGPPASLDSSIANKIAALKVMSERLPHLQRHDALLLLRHSLAIPKILYLLRTAPCFLSSKLEDFDCLLRSTLSAVLNINLSDNLVWLQASLPVSNGGLGVRSAVQLAPSAFLASAAGCTSLTRRILPSHLHNLPIPEVGLALNHWSQDGVLTPPASPDKSKQKAWDHPKVESSFDLLINKCQNPTARARLLGAASKESGAWLNAPPVSSLGLRMDNDCISICVGLRLGVPLCHPHLCHQCGSPVDEYALHGLSCVKSQGRHPRHNNLNEIIHSSLTAAGVPSQKEPYGLARSDGKRPDGVTMLPWKCGRPLIWDATCSDTFAKSYLHVATNRPGAVADLAESRKIEMYHHLKNTHIIAPVAVESSGAFGSNSLQFLRELASRLRSRTGNPFAYQHLLQQLSVLVQRGNAISVRGSMHDDDVMIGSDFF